MQLRSLNQDISVSRVEKLMKDLKRETDRVEAVSEAISRGFKEVLGVNDERVDNIVRQFKAEAELERKQALDHVKKKPSASSADCCPIM
ncbi:hypothetical protein CTI12_AA035840 [Artemisia annua]|uniref:Uncharacterized protein n=1 Tax=Artemisia annua TaxID=35608 RepID=A0A2U1QFM0_ARTAN|nr:hypothetical protein CTI12_AA035840 [Artemisia annua]